MVDLPYDICCAIASHLEKDHLLKLASINREFYNIVLDTRYGEIWWVKLDKYMIRTLTRLQYVSVQSSHQT